MLALGYTLPTRVSLCWIGTHYPADSLFMQIGTHYPVDSLFMLNTWRLLRWPPAASFVPLRTRHLQYRPFPPPPSKDHTANIHTVDDDNTEATSAPFVSRSTSLLVYDDFVGGAYPSPPNCSKMATLKPLFFSFVLAPLLEEDGCDVIYIRHSDVSCVCPKLSARVCTRLPSRGITINYYYFGIVIHVHS
jgi:hypothetical protein